MVQAKVEASQAIVTKEGYLAQSRSRFNLRTEEDGSAGSHILHRLL